MRFWLQRTLQPWNPLDQLSHFCVRMGALQRLDGQKLDVPFEGSLADSSAGSGIINTQSLKHVIS
jgi:hypothetical protein